MECQKNSNLSVCNCSYQPCPRKGMCCECLDYHRNSRELPTCFFPAAAEKTYDRSFGHFARLLAAGKVRNACANSPAEMKFPERPFRVISAVRNSCAAYLAAH
jgi:uncharacterized protein DUF6485